MQDPAMCNKSWELPDFSLGTLVLEHREGAGSSSAAARVLVAYLAVSGSTAVAEMHSSPPGPRFAVLRLSIVSLCEGRALTCAEHASLAACCLQYLANFTATFDYVPLQPHPFDWSKAGPPFCALGFLGCTYVG